MMEQKNKKCFGLRQLLAALLVIVLCCALIVPAAAVETVTNTATEETAAEPEEEIPYVLTAEDVEAAWDALVQAMSPEQTIQYNNTITNLRQPNGQSYLNEGLYNSIVTTVDCVETEARIQLRLADIYQKIGQNEGLSDEQKIQLQVELSAKMEEDQFAAVDFLMLSAEYLTADINYIMPAGELIGYQEVLAQKEALLTGVEALLESTAQIPQLDAQLQGIQAALSADAAGSARKDNLLLSVNELAKLREEIDVSIAEYFSMTEQEQTELYQQIRQLAADVEAFPNKTTVGILEALDILDAELDTTNEALKNVGDQMIIGYIALIVAAVGILMAIAVTAFSIGKARGEKVDLSVMASREDVDATNRQNQILRDQLEQMDMRMEHTSKMLEEYRRKMDTMAAAPVQEAKLDQAVVLTPVEPPVDEKPEEEYLGSDEKICNLRMNYQFVNPASSYLQMDPAGTVTLFADNTVEPVASEMQIANELKGWINNGLFIMFEVEVNGKLLDADRDKIPAGYYSIGKLVCRPRVRLSGKSYLIERKGYIKMQ